MPLERNLGASRFCVSQFCLSVSLSIYGKTLTLAKTFEPIEVETSYFACNRNLYSQQYLTESCVPCLL